MMQVIVACQSCPLGVPEAAINASRNTFKPALHDRVKAAL